MKNLFEKQRDEKIEKLKSEIEILQSEQFDPNKVKYIASWSDS